MVLWFTSQVEDLGTLSSKRSEVWLACQRIRQSRAKTSLVEYPSCLNAKNKMTDIWEHDSTASRHCLLSCFIFSLKIHVLLYAGILTTGILTNVPQLPVISADQRLLCPEGFINVVKSGVTR